MKKLFVLFLSIAISLSAIAGCAESSTQGAEADFNNTLTENVTVLTAFFSRADENYRVGYIEKGNTQVIAEYIEETIETDTFKIERSTPYPAEYRACTAEAQEEKNANARPALKTTLDSIEQYDVIFLGYPNWWGTMPMPVFTFLESYDWTGKTIITFNTHEGSGFGSSISDIRSICTGATIIQGFSCTGSSVSSQRSAVSDWLNSLTLA